MTNTPIEQLIAIAIPYAAMCKAIVTAHPEGDGWNRTRLIVIAHAHGGGTLLAEALELRMGLVGLLYQVDPSIVQPKSLRVEDLARILIEIELSVVDGVLQFDLDDLINRLRLVSAPLGQA